MNVTLEGLRKTHGDKAEAIFREISRLGGFGDVNPGYRGGLDIGGLRHDLGGAVPEDSVKRIEDLIAGDKLKSRSEKEK